MLGVVTMSSISYLGPWPVWELRSQLQSQQSVALIGVALIGVALIGVALIGVALIGVALIGVALIGVALVSMLGRQSSVSKLVWVWGIELSS